MSSQKTKHKVMKKMAKKKMNGKIKNMAGRFILDIQWRQARIMQKWKNRKVGKE